MNSRQVNSSKMYVALSVARGLALQDLLLEILGSSKKTREEFAVTYLVGAGIGIAMKQIRRKNK